MPDLEPLWRILIAAGLTVPIGLDRELRGKAAGLRTHVVVGVASAALGYLSVASAFGTGNDRTRIASQVVTGIGFLGAGVIFATGSKVHGLTTAAALWAAMAIGLSAGMRATTLATSLAVVTFAFLGPLDWFLDRILYRVAKEERTFHVLVDDAAAAARVNDCLVRAGAPPRQLVFGQVGDATVLTLLLRCRPADALEVARQLRTTHGVRLVADESLERMKD